MKSTFYYTKMKQKKTIKILKILFKYIFPIKCQQMAIIILVTFSCGINCQFAETIWVFHLCHDFFRLLAHSLHLNLNVHIPGSNIYIYDYWAKCAKVGFSGCVARGSAPQLKLPSQKGNPPIGFQTILGLEWLCGLGPWLESRPTVGVPQRVSGKDSHRKI